MILKHFILCGAMLVPALASDQSWRTIGRDSQHAGLTRVAPQDPAQIHWQTPVDLAPQYSGNELLIHYGSPVITGNNTVIVPVKTDPTGGFRVEAHKGSDGSLLWSMTTDYVLPPHEWVPEFGPALSSLPVLYLPAAGGTVIARGTPDQAAGKTERIAFYGTGNYNANPAAYTSTVMIDTPITSDADGNIYFGFQVTGANPLNLESGIARVTVDGQGTWISASAAAHDSSINKVVTNCAPALDGRGHLYITVSNGSFGYLVLLDSTTLAPLAQHGLKDVQTGLDASLNDIGTASPMIGPDGDVYIGVLENPPLSNHDRGWLLHFSGDLSQSKIPGDFGWDSTPTLVPASLVPSYTGLSSYLLMIKYNNYAGLGGDGVNKIAILDPNAVETDPSTGAVVMNEVITKTGLTPDPAWIQEFPNAVNEWCINSAAVDAASRVVFAGSEDGKLYRWDLTTNTFTQILTLTPGLGEAYTPTAIGPDGTVYAINNAVLFAAGN